jgi:hypothetical protein
MGSDPQRPALRRSCAAHGHSGVISAALVTRYHQREKIIAISGQDPLHVQRSDRIKHKKLTHLGIRQVADSFADVQDGILKIFGPHHSLAVTSLQIPKLVDVVTDRECVDIVVRKQDAAAACNLFGREV